MEAKYKEYSKNERYIYELGYYNNEIQKCKYELAILKATMRNLDAEELNIKKMSQHILESKLEYYTILVKLSKEEKKEKMTKVTKQSIKKKQTVEKKQDLYSNILDKYYTKMIKRVSAHML